MQSTKTDDDAVDEASTKDEMECSTEETASEMFHRDDAAKVMAGKNKRDMNGVDPYPCLA